MKETVGISHHTEERNFQTTLLLTERLAQLGYQCLTDQCEQFTTLRLMPLEQKQKEELSTPPSE